MSLIDWREIQLGTRQLARRRFDVQDPPVHWPWLHGPHAPERAGTTYIEHAWRVQAKEEGA